MQNPYTTSEDIRCKVCDGTATDDWFTERRVCDGCGHGENLCDCTPADVDPDYEEAMDAYASEQRAKEEVR